MIYISASILLIFIFTVVLSKRIRELILKNKWWIFISFFIFIALVVTGLTKSDFFVIDSCLDNGGSWNKEAQTCDICCL